MKIRIAPLTATRGARALLCLLAYCAAAALCILLSVRNGNSSPVWLPTGVALAAVLRWHRPMLAAVAAGSLAVNLYLMARGPGLGAASGAAAGAITTANVLALAGAYWLIRHCGRTLRRHSPMVVHGYLLAAALAAAFSAAAGSLALAAAGAVAPADVARVGTLWWLGDLMAMLLVTPLIAAWTAPPELRRLRQRWRGTLALLALTALATFAVYRLAPAPLRPWAPFLLLVPVLAGAFRYGALASTGAAAIAAAGAVWVTLAGTGPFATRDQFYSLLGLDIYLALLAISGMVISNTAAGHYRDGNGLRPGRWPVVTLALCLAITAAAWHGIGVYAERRIEEQFRTIVDGMWRQMDYRMANYRRMLTAGKAFFDASATVGAAEWRAYVSDFDLQQAFPGTLGLGFATWVPQAEAAAFVAGRRAERPGFRIWPEPARWPAAIVTYLEPDNAENARPYGFNMLFDGVRSAALLDSIRRGRIGSTPALTLVHDLDQRSQKGFLMFVPVYRRGADVGTPAARLAAVRGVIYSPFRIGHMVTSMIGTQPAFTLRIRDLPGGAGGQLIYDNTPAVPQRGERYVKPLTQGRTLTIDEAGHAWHLDFTATASFEAGVDRGSPLLTLGLGSLISFLLFEIVRGLASTRARALAIAQEITRELQRQQRAVRQSEERFRLFTASVASHAIIFLDAAGRVEAWNEGATNLFGHPDAATVGRPLDLWAEPALGRALLAEATARGAATAVARLCRQDGQVFLGDLQLTAVRRDDVLTGFAFIVRDVTAARQAEARLREAVAIAESASRAKSAFVANMSHELRTPMNGVLGIAALLDRGRLDKEQRELVRMIRSSGETLLAVLNDILDFSKIEAGKAELHPEPFALDDVALACARLMAVHGGGRLDLLVDVAPTLPPTIVADALRLEQILTNLVGNALKFTEHGSVACRFAPATLADGAPALRVDVTDTGIGIDPEQQKRLFSPFAQADTSTTRRFGGTGLGLTIARSLADLMGGTLTLRSAPGAGSTFTLTVPLQAAPGAADRYALPDSDCHLHVLLCEPDARVAAALADATARWGWHLHVVPDDEHVAALLEAPALQSDLQPDLPPDALPDVLPHALAIAGPGARHGAILGLLAGYAARLPAHFALIRISAGFDVPAGDVAVPCPSAIVHAPATRAALHAAVLDVRRARAAPAAPLPAATGAQPLAGLRVLLAEDNPINQTVAMALLDYAGASVAIAGDGRVALDMLGRRPDAYDVVLMDVQMPEMDGLTAARAIRERLRLALPIVAMTAGVTQEERDACVAAGMDGFIAKPIDEDELVAALIGCVPAGRASSASSATPR